MNKTLWILILSTALHSAWSENTLPPPKPPLLAKLPAYAAWTETVKDPSGQAKTEAADSASGSPSAIRTLKEILVVKGPQNRQIVKKWSDGLKTETWICGGTVLQEEPGLKSIFISTESSRSASPMSFGAGFSRADFPDLEWISLSNYTGTQTFQGKHCYVFQSESASAEAAKWTKLGASLPSAESPQPSPADSTSAQPPVQAPVKTAWIDPETRLPVAFRDGTQLRIYTFQTPPSLEPQLPQKFRAALEKYEAAARGPVPVSR